jgi:putative PEP-CTERM system TPR-repeat lipoprotein
MWRQAIRLVVSTLLASVAVLHSACSPDPTPDAAQSLARAEALAQQGQRAQAINVLLTALRTEPEHPALRWRLGRLYLEVSAFEFAESHLLAALRAGISPSSVLPLVARARLMGDDLKALVETDVPSDLSAEALATVLALQARGYVLLKQFDAAQTQLKWAASEAPQSEAVGVAWAHLHSARGRPRRAQQELRRLLAEHPKSSEGLGMLADLVRNAGDLEEAERLYGLALQHSSFKVHLHFLRAEVRLDLGDVAGAEEDAAEIEEAVPGTFAALYPRARLLLVHGELEQALTTFESANKLQSFHTATLLYGGAAAYALGRVTLAEDWLLRVFNEAPGSAAARLLLGTIRFDQGRYEEAESYLRPLPRTMPRSVVPRRLLAAALVAQDKAAEAVPLLGELVARKPDDARSQLDLSVALVLSGAKERGVAALDALAARHPDYRPVYEYLIAYHVREAQWPEAVQWSERFVARYPGDVQALFFRGETLLKADREAEARSAFEQAMEIEPGHPGANMRLAELALTAGDTAVAMAYFDRILAVDPQNLDALLGHAGLAAGRQRFDEAAVLLGKAISAHPDALLPRMLLARQELSRRHPQRAVAALQEGASPGLRQSGSYLRLLTESLLAADAPHLAADVARELVALQPESLLAYGLYSQVLTLLDDKVALEDTLKQMLTIDPGHVPTRLELVRLHIATERFSVAERLLSPLLADLDRPPLADLLYGLILTATDRAAQAVGPLKHAHRRLSSQRTLLALANAEAQGGHIEDAIARQQAWLEERPDDVEVRVSFAGHLVQAERVSEAIAAYEYALEVNPDHVVALNNLAWYSLDADTSRAVELAQRAMELRPESLEAAHTLVSAQVEAGQWRDAELTLDRALARHPTDPGLLWLSARVLHQKGRAEGALRRLERLLEDDIPGDERKRAEVLLTQIQDELGAEADERAW